MDKLAVVLMILAALPAQQPEGPAARLRTTTRLVQLNFVATDKAGRGVEDLSREELILTEDGKPQDLRVFSLQRGDQTGTGAKALPAGFFSNRLEYRGGVPNSATVILVDLINTPVDFYGRARPQISAFLHRADPRFRIAVYGLSRRGLRVLVDFTTDAALLRRPLPEVLEALPMEMSTEAADFLAEKGDPAKSAAVFFGKGDALDLAAAILARLQNLERGLRREQETLSTIQALQAIARRLSVVPGRKNLVWVTTGFGIFVQPPPPPRAGPGTFRAINVNPDAIRRSSFSAEFERALREFNDASVAVYPIDARGLLALADNLVVAGSTARTMPSRGQVSFEPSVTPSRSTMEQIAARTGGKLFFGEEVEKALPEVFEHARVSYTVGYYPSNANFDGKFRRIGLRTTRRGVKLSYRTGYYAVPDAATAEEQMKTELMGAVWSPVDATSLPLDARLERAPGAAADERTLEVLVDGGALSFEPHPKGLACRLNLYLVQKTAEGRQVDGTFDNIEIVVTEPQARTLRQRGFVHRKPLRIKPEAAILRAVVRNAATGTLGTVSIPLR